MQEDLISGYISKDTIWLPLPVIESPAVVFKYKTSMLTTGNATAAARCMFFVHVLGR